MSSCFFNVLKVKHVTSQFEVLLFKFQNSNVGKKSGHLVRSRLKIEVVLYFPPLLLHSAAVFSARQTSSVTISFSISGLTW